MKKKRSDTSRKTQSVIHLAVAAISPVRMLFSIEALSRCFAVIRMPATSDPSGIYFELIFDLLAGEQNTDQGANVRQVLSLGLFSNPL